MQEGRAPVIVRISLGLAGSRSLDRRSDVVGGVDPWLSPTVQAHKWGTEALGQRPWPMGRVSPRLSAPRWVMEEECLVCPGGARSSSCSQGPSHG